MLNVSLNGKLSCARDIFPHKIHSFSFVVGGKKNSFGTREMLYRDTATLRCLKSEQDNKKVA
jgi:hypothetical protein